MGVPSSVRGLAMTAASVFSSRARARVCACEGRISPMLSRLSSTSALSSSNLALSAA
jgi:hypothetical protein